MKSEIGVCVISLEGSTKGADLVEKLKKSNLFQEIVNVKAIEPNTNSCLVNDGHIHPGSSRNYSCREIATSASHQQARKIAYEAKWGSALILEEDAILTSKFFTFMKSYLPLDTKAPIMWHLFPEQFGILKIAPTKTHYKVVKIPDFAVGYIANRAALKIFIKNENLLLGELADWPRTARKISWLAPLESIIQHPKPEQAKEDSTIANSRDIELKNAGILKRMNFEYVFKNLIFKLSKMYSKPYGFNEIPNPELRTRVLYSRCRNDIKIA